MLLKTHSGDFPAAGIIPPVDWARSRLVTDRDETTTPCIARLDLVIPVLSEADAPEYWQRLREMARLVAESPHSSHQVG